MADVDINKLKTKRYRCLKCGNEFKGLGKKVVCPSCQSEEVECKEWVGKLKIDFNPDEILFLEGETGVVGIVKVADENKMLIIATQDNEEIVQFLESDDIIAVSSFKGDKRAIKSLAYLTREEDSPLLILNKQHPSVKRLSIVVSVGDEVNLNCNITPGTHPEQNVLCSCDSLSGLQIKTPTGVEINKDVKYNIEEF